MARGANSSAQCDRLGLPSYPLNIGIWYLVVKPCLARTSHRLLLDPFVIKRVVDMVLRHLAPLRLLLLDLSLLVADQPPHCPKQRGTSLCLVAGGNYTERSKFGKGGGLACPIGRWFRVGRLTSCLGRGKPDACSGSTAFLRS